MAQEYPPQEEDASDDGTLIATPNKLSLVATITRADGTVEEIELEDLNIAEIEPSK